MEKTIEKQLDDIMNSPGVIGVLCTDSKGLCLGVRGKVSGSSAGHISSLAKQAAKLHVDGAESPVISVETDIGTVLIKAQDDITMAIFKS